VSTKKARRRTTDGVIDENRRMRDSTVRRLSRLHSFVFGATRGRIGRRLVGNDMLLLSTTGRISGKRHTVPLLYLEDGETLVVIASWGGRDHHPHWYLNLVERPAVVVNVNGRRREAVARTANADARVAWWPRIVEAYDGYHRYQSGTDREIPVVLLEPGSL
jgi:deazaflavin-dependent oxidoreductase (nitroreductase family)